MDQKFLCSHFNLKNTHFPTFATYPVSNGIYECKGEVSSRTGTLNALLHQGTWHL